MNRLFNLTIAVAVPILAAGCGNLPPGSPLAPSEQPSAYATLDPSSTRGLGLRSASTHGQQLSAVIGTGSGIVNVTPTAAVDGSFSAQIEVNVHDATPNTTFYVQRAPEVGRANGADGICQRAAGQPPWGPPAPNFVTFPLPAAGPLVVLETSSGGAGSVHLDFTAATIADGTQFDVMFRLVDSLTSPSNDLRTGCFTVAVK
jgi:hypothetical protein